MNIRNVFIVTFISLSQLYLCGMENNTLQINNDITKKPSIENRFQNSKRSSDLNIASPSPDKKIRTEYLQESTAHKPGILFSELQNNLMTLMPEQKQIVNIELSPLVLKIRQVIHNMDPIALNNALATAEVSQLSKEEKNNLYKAAKEQKLLIKTINDMGNTVANQTDSQEIKTKFLCDIEYKSIQTITRNLYALKTLQKLTFPQAVFTNPPYSQNLNLKPTPDQALLALIKNEQEKISICCFHITLESIAQALVKRKNEGISVEVITNQKQGDIGNKTTDPNKQINYLVTNKIPLFWPKNKPTEQMHHKIFLFNRNILNKPLVVTGSYNPTPHGNLNSWDDLIILEDSEIINEYQQRLECIKEKSIALI